MEQSQVNETCVKVAVRIRPLNLKEQGERVEIWTKVTPSPKCPNVHQIYARKKYGFSFNHVFDMESSQPELFEIIKNLIDGTLEGRNNTILTYGQTGSGKSYTMGTAFSSEESSEISENSGIIHRSVQYLFDKISYSREVATERNVTPPTFQISAQYVELYDNDEIEDLIAEANGPRSVIKIVENTDKSIHLDGVSSKPIESVVDALRALQRGNLSRQTGTTHRSHAIFTLYVTKSTIITHGSSDCVTSSKINFVDLAGSERLNRTGPVEERPKDGISINSGLLALNNVLLALKEMSPKASQVPFRNSKLTYFLSDSLGGDSDTVMIACICPCELDISENLNTLRYANTAMNIKKKQVAVNQDKSSRTISLLQKQIVNLEAKLQAQAYREEESSKTILQLRKQILESDAQAGQSKWRGEGDESKSDLMSENRMLLAELETLRSQNIALSETNNQLMREKLVNSNTNLPSDAPTAAFAELITTYVLRIESWKSRALKAESLIEQLNKRDEETTSLSNSSLSLQEVEPIGVLNGPVDTTRVKIEKLCSFSKYG